MGNLAAILDFMQLIVTLNTDMWAVNESYLQTYGVAQILLVLSTQNQSPTGLWIKSKGRYVFCVMMFNTILVG